MCIKPTVIRVVVGLAAFAALLTGIIFFAISFQRTDENTACVKWNEFSGSVDPDPITDATFGLYAPYTTFECIDTSLVILRFEGDSGINKRISSRTVSGMPVRLTLEVEFRFDAARVRDILIQSDQDSAGNIDTERHFTIAARSVLRNVASTVTAQEFLRGSREAIAAEMARALQVEYDELHGLVNRINILEVEMDADFTGKFIEVEQLVIDQRVRASEGELEVIQQQQLKEREQIQALADRDRILQEKRTELIEAQLDFVAQETVQDTETSRVFIQKESERAIALVQEQAKVEEAEAERTLRLQETNRQRTEQLELAETARAAVNAEFLGRIETANATRTQDILRAQIAQQALLETLEVLKIENQLALFTTELDANVTAQQIETAGKIAAQNLLANLQPDIEKNKGLIDRLGLTAEQAVQVVWYAHLKNNDAADQFVDYERVPGAEKGVFSGATPLVSLAEAGTTA